MKGFRKFCAVLAAASLCVMSCMTAFADDVVVSNAAMEKAANDAAATDVSQYKPATQSDDPNGVIATGDAIEKAAEMANAALVTVAGVSNQTLDFPNAAGQTVLHLSYGMLDASENSSAGLRQAIAAWNLQNAATLATQAVSLAGDAASVNAINGSAYSISQTITMGLNNDQYFSFLVTTTQDTGGAHPNTTSQGVTMDAATGKILSWSDMTPYLSDFRTLVISEIEGSLSETYGSNLLPEADSNVESAVNNGTITWYMTASGMNFVLDPYSVLPYSYGTVTESIANLILQGYGMVQ